MSDGSELYPCGVRVSIPFLGVKSESSELLIRNRFAHSDDMTIFVLVVLFVCHCIGVQPG